MTTLKSLAFFRFHETKLYHFIISIVHTYFILISGSDHKTVTRLFRVIGSHFANHFSVIIMKGSLCSDVDPYQLGNLHPVSVATKWEKQGRRLKKVKQEVSFLDGKGMFSCIDFPVTCPKWEDEVKTDRIVKARNLTPKYKLGEPVKVAFFKRRLPKKDKELPLNHPGLAIHTKDLANCDFRVVNFDGCVIKFISQSARKDGHGLIMALNDYCGPFRSTFAAKPMIMSTIIDYFVRAIVVAGLPLGKYKYMIIKFQIT